MCKRGSHVSEGSVQCANVTCMSWKTTTGARSPELHTYVYTHTHTVLMDECLQGGGLQNVCIVIHICMSVNYIHE